MKKTETRLSEIRFKTSDLKRMLNKYIVRTVTHKWQEKYFDTQTGENTEITRTEILFDKGTFIDEKVLSSIQFYKDTGKLTDPVEVSNQKRLAHTGPRHSLYPYKVVAGIAGKRKTFLLYAVSVSNAIAICSDFIELNFEGYFNIVSVSAMEYCTILVDNLKNPVKKTDLDIAYLKNEMSLEEFAEATVNAIENGNTDLEEESTKETRRFYQISARILLKDINQVEADEEKKGLFIVHTYSAVRANMIIEKYLHDEQQLRYEESKKHPDRTFVMHDIYSLIEESKIIAASSFIPKEFSLAYYEAADSDS